MYFKKISFCLLMLLLYVTICLAAQNDCLFNKEAIERPTFLQSTEFSKVHWDNSDKTAHVVTKKNEILVVRYSACENFGVEAKLNSVVIDTKVLTQKYIADKITWLAKKIIENENDLSKIKKAVNSRNFNSYFKNGIYTREEILLNVSSKYYSELTIGIKYSDNCLIVTLDAINF